MAAKKPNNKNWIDRAKPKINLIKELMEFEEYKNYLGLEKFNDYITIDQNFACDNLEKTKKNIKKQLLKVHLKYI